MCNQFRLFFLALALGLWMPSSCSEGSGPKGEPSEISDSPSSHPEFVLVFKPERGRRDFRFSVAREGRVGCWESTELTVLRRGETRVSPEIVEKLLSLGAGVPKESAMGDGLHSGNLYVLARRDQASVAFLGSLVPESMKRLFAELQAVQKTISLEENLSYFFEAVEVSKVQTAVIKRKAIQVLEADGFIGTLREKFEECSQNSRVLVPVSRSDFEAVQRVVETREFYLRTNGRGLFQIRIWSPR